MRWCSVDSTREHVFEHANVVYVCQFVLAVSRRGRDYFGCCWNLILCDVQWSPRGKHSIWKVRFCTCVSFWRVRRGQDHIDSSCNSIHFDFQWAPKGQMFLNSACVLFTCVLFFWLARDKSHIGFLLALDILRRSAGSKRKCLLFYLFLVVSARKSVRCLWGGAWEALRCTCKCLRSP